MRTKSLKILLALWLSMTLVSFTFAQRQTGSLTGKIVDDTGEPLPGVSLTVSSPALLGTQDFVSSESGDFRFPSLPPGTYAIACELDGFKTVTMEGLIIRVGKTTTINITLEPTTLEEEVTVTAETPVVDVKSTKVSVSFTRQLLDNIPMERDLYDIMTAAPGTISEEVTYRRTFSSHGSTTAGSKYALDGVDMTDPSVRYPITNLNFDLYEEVEMELGAHPADVGDVSGAYINVVTRSGGNEFHGQGTLYYFNKSFVDSNFSEEQLDSLRVSTPAKDQTSQDFSLNLGGPVIKDRLWFFISGRYLKWERLYTGFPVDATHTEWFGFGKLTAQLTRNIKLMGFFNYINIYEPYFSLQINPYVTPDGVTQWGHENGKVINVQLNWIINQNAFFDLRGMWVNRYVPWVQRSDATHPNFDRGTGMTSDSGRFSEDWNRGSLQFIPSLSLFLDDFLGGDHELKIGAEYKINSVNYDCWMVEDPIKTYTNFGSPYYYGGNVGQFIAYGMGREPRVNETADKAYFLAFYLQDAWTIADRVTLNIGGRYISSHLDLPEQFAEEVSFWLWLDPDFFARHDYPAYKDIVAFQTFSPRLGVIFDVFGTGKTVARANYARYYDPIQGTYASPISPNSGYSQQFYIWTDTNLNGEIDPADGFNKLSTYGRLDVEPYDLVDPDAKAAYWNEFIVGLDHELLADFRIGVSFIYKHQARMFEDTQLNSEQNWSSQFTVADPGYDAVFGTGDDQQLTLWDRPGIYEGKYLTNPKDAWRKYRGLELIFEKRMANKWQLFGSIVFSKMYGTIGGNYLTAYTYTPAFDTPNWYINREGRSDFDRPLVIKMAGTYQLPYGIILSAAFQLSSGSPFTRQVNVFAPLYGTYVTVNAEQQGIRRTQSINRLDLRLEKEFAVSDFGRLGIYVDVFNAFNSGYINVYSEIHGYIEADGSFRQNPSWHSVSGISSPRRLKLGVRFSF